MRIRTSSERKDQGFTLIELLVVVVIIGILAAIAIPVFLNQREKAEEAGVKSDLKNVATVLESEYVDAQTYPANQTALEAVVGYKVTGDNVISYTLDAGGDAYCITGKTDTAATDTFYYDSNNGGLLTGTATC